MALITFHDDCSSLDGWIKSYGRDLETNGTELYFDPSSFSSNQYNSSYSKTAFNGNPAVFGDVCTVKFKCNDGYLNNGLMTLEVRFSSLNLFVLTRKTTSGTIERWAGVVSGTNVATQLFSLSDEYKNVVRFDEYIEDIEVSVIKNGENVFEVYVNKSYIGVINDFSTGTIYDVLLEARWAGQLLWNPTDILMEVSDIEFDWNLTPVEQFSLSMESLTLVKGQYVNVDLNIVPENAYYLDTIFDYGDESVATGLVYGQDVGRTHITVTIQTLDEDTLEPVEFSDTIAVTVLTNILNTPSKPIFNGTKLYWNEIPNALYYKVILYVESVDYTGGFHYSNEIYATDYELGTYIENAYLYFTAPIVTATVKAYADRNPYYPSEESEASNAFTPTTLPQVKQPVWVDYKLTWEDVENAISYVVRLYNEAGVVVSIQTVAPGVKLFDFGSILSAGTFTATVQASEVAIE